MQPQNGNWVGLFITQGGTTVRIVFELTFRDNSVEGSFTVTPFAPGSWRGPKQGRISAGTYSAQGDIHMEEVSNTGNFGTATFDGVYSVDGEAEMIRGTVLVTRGAEQQIGTLNIYATESSTAGGALSAHVWGE